MKKLLFILIIIVISSCNTDYSPTKSSACMQSEYCVKQELRDPSSAEFARCSDSKVIELSEARYKVTGSVRSRNGFGGMVNSEYIVILEFKNHKDWTKGCTFTVDLH